MRDLSRFSTQTNHAKGNNIKSSGLIAQRRSHGQAQTNIAARFGDLYSTNNRRIHIVLANRLHESLASHCQQNAQTIVVMTLCSSTQATR